MNKTLYPLILLSIFPVLAFCKTPSYSSQYTSLTKCKITDSSDRDPKAEMDFFASECPAPKGYRVFHNGGDSRSWLEIKGPNFYLDTQHGSSFFPGQFPNVDGDKLEWRYKDGHLMGLIFRMSGLDPEDPHLQKRIRKLILVRIQQAKACVVGSTNTNEKAREILSLEKPCP